MEGGSHWPLHGDTGQGINGSDVTFRQPWFTQGPAPGADLVSTRGDSKIRPSVADLLQEEGDRVLTRMLSSN